MAKIIVFTVINSGIDGRERDVIVYANESESERDKWFNASKNKDWYRKSEKIIDVEKIRTNVIHKMNVIERLVMGRHEAKLIKNSDAIIINN